MSSKITSTFTTLGGLTYVITKKNAKYYDVSISYADGDTFIIAESYINVRYEINGKNLKIFGTDDTNNVLSEQLLVTGILTDASYELYKHLDSTNITIPKPQNMNNHVPVPPNVIQDVKQTDFKAPSNNIPVLPSLPTTDKLYKISPVFKNIIHDDDVSEDDSHPEYHDHPEDIISEEKKDISDLHLTKEMQLLLECDPKTENFKTVVNILEQLNLLLPTLLQLVDTNYYQRLKNKVDDILIELFKFKVLYENKLNTPSTDKEVLYKIKYNFGEKLRFLTEDFHNILNQKVLDSIDNLSDYNFDNLFEFLNNYRNMDDDETEYVMKFVRQ